MIENPILSIVVVTYNQANTIRQTLDAILAQKTDNAFEIIIGEDASPSDNTREICEQYATDYPEIICLMPKAPNKGVLKNYADCLAEARGKYIATCAGDDWWHNPLKVQMQVEYLETHPEFGVVHTDMDIWSVNSGRIIPASGTRQPPEGDIHEKLYKVCFINAPTTMYRRDMLNHVDLDEFIRLDFKMEDYPMWFEISRHAKFHFINESTVTYSVFASSLSHSDNIISRIRFLDETKKIQDYYYEKYKPELDMPLHYMQNRMYYMECLKYGDYSRSFKYIDGLNFPKPLLWLLHTYLGGWLCRKIINSNFYKRRRRL